MSREIKFRAWDTLQGGKFEYWDSVANKFDGIFWTMIKHKSFKEPQQYTGMKDKNGKEIYEGDIVKDSQNNIFRIVYEDAGFNARYGDGLNYYPLLNFYIYPNKSCSIEIIGTQTDNQKEFEENVKALGFEYYLWNKFEDAQAFVKEIKK